MTIENEKTVFYLPVKSWGTVTPSSGEVNTLPSMTVPDQCLSIREILIRYAKGLPISASDPLYDGEDADFDDLLPDPARMDLEEREAFRNQAIDELKDFTVKSLKKQKNERSNKPANEGQTTGGGSATTGTGEEIPSA